MPGLFQFEPGAPDPFAPPRPDPGAVTVALEMALGPPVTSISQGSSVLESGARELVVVRADLRDMTRGFPVDPTQFPVLVAITPGAPLVADFLEAEWLLRSADLAPGDYAALLVGPGGALDPGAGHYRVTVRLAAGGEVLVERAPGFLTIE